jgi:hypothetical protein
MKYSNEHPIIITMLDDMERHFDLNIVIYNIPIYFFFAIQKIGFNM